VVACCAVLSSLLLLTQPAHRYTGLVAVASYTATQTKHPYQVSRQALQLLVQQALQLLVQQAQQQQQQQQQQAALLAAQQ
jgi:hypothetical protein